MAGVYGMALTIGGERWTQTLSPLLATPANRFALFMGRALPNFVNGLIVSTFGFLVGWALLDFDPPLSAVPGLALVRLRLGGLLHRARDGDRRRSACARAT